MHRMRQCVWVERVLRIRSTQYVGRPNGGIGVRPPNGTVARQPADGDQQRCRYRRPRDQVVGDGNDVGLSGPFGVDRVAHTGDCGRYGKVVQYLVKRVLAPM